MSFIFAFFLSLILSSPLSLSFPPSLVGEPIPVVQTPSPSSEDIEVLHGKYMRALSELFEQNKHLYGVPDDRHISFI